MLKRYLFIILISFAYISAQTSSDSVKFGFRAGIGTFTGEIDNGITTMAGMFVVSKSHIFSTCYVYGEPLMNIMGPQPVNHHSDIGILYGRQYSNRFIRCAGSAGLSMVSGNRRGNIILYTDPGWFGAVHYNETFYSTIGLPIEAEISFIYFKYVALGIQGFGNINGKNPYWGANIWLGLGILK